MRRQNSEAGRKKGKLNRFALCALLLSALLLFSLVKLEQKIRPVARTMAEYECRERAVRWMQAAVGDCLRRSPELLEDLYILRYDETGLVQSAETDTAKLARLQYTLEGDLTQAMEEGKATRATALTARRISPSRWAPFWACSFFPGAGRTSL